MNGVWQVDKGFENYPMLEVTRHGAIAFVQWLSKKTGQHYQLPSEAQWEYACRSGGKNETYSGTNQPEKVAWYKKNSQDQIYAVGQKQANNLNIHDMSGNLWEWVQDAYREDAYRHHTKKNPVISEGESYIFRGGSWGDTADFIRCTVRSDDASQTSNSHLGFRVIKR